MPTPAHNTPRPLRFFAQVWIQGSEVPETVMVDSLALREVRLTVHCGALKPEDMLGATLALKDSSGRWLCLRGTLFQLLPAGERSMTLGFRVDPAFADCVGWQQLVSNPTRLARCSLSSTSFRAPQSSGWENSEAPLSQSA